MWKGKRFYQISKIIGTKNTKQCVEFYYYWKQSSHYKIWKALGRKTNKKATSSSKIKLHRRIGQKFGEFHQLHTELTPPPVSKGPVPVDSIRNGVDHLNVNSNSNSNVNGDEIDHSVLL